MKRILLSALIVGLLTGPALASMYVLDTATALTFTKISNSDSGAFPAKGDLDGVYQKPSPAYGSMKLEVGFVGELGDGTDADHTASITIGKAGLGLIGYDGVTTCLANDDDDPWSVQLYLVDGAGTHTSPLVYLTPGSSTCLSVQGSGTISEIGFTIQGTFDDVSPSNPDYFHISAVPIPGAILLGILGLAMAGLRLRRFA